jgi:hypothetical protein
MCFAWLLPLYQRQLREQQLDAGQRRREFPSVCLRFCAVRLGELGKKSFRPAMSQPARDRELK